MDNIDVFNRPHILIPVFVYCAGFGFLASEEVKAAGVGNLGLQDRKDEKSYI